MFDLSKPANQELIQKEKTFFELTGKTEPEWLLDNAIDLLTMAKQRPAASVNVSESHDHITIEVWLADRKEMKEVSNEV